MKDPGTDLDRGRLARLGAFDDPAVAAIIENFLETLDDRIAAMAATAAAGDTGSLIRQAHQLRGSAANCGFCVLAAACSALDSAPSGFGAVAFRKLAARARRAWQEACGP
jgi:HPt (histidine-containing phosphotransfer) domain-containing protein